MLGLDRTNVLIWGGMTLFGILLYAAAAWGAWDIGVRVGRWLLQDAGSLSACAGLTAADCVALAQEGL